MNLFAAEVRGTATISASADRDGSLRSSRLLRGPGRGSGSDDSDGDASQQQPTVGRMRQALGDRAGSPGTHSSTLGAADIDRTRTPVSS